MNTKVERYYRGDSRLHQLECEVSSLNAENDLLNAKLANARAETEDTHRKWLLTVIVAVVSIVALICFTNTTGERPSNDVVHLQTQLARCHDTVKRLSERNEALIDEVIQRDIEAADISESRRARWWRKCVALCFICLVAFVTWKWFFDGGENNQLKLKNKMNSINVDQ